MITLKQYQRRVISEISAWRWRNNWGDIPKSALGMSVLLNSSDD